MLGQVQPLNTLPNFNLEKKDLNDVFLFAALSQLVYFPRSIFTSCFYPSQSQTTAKKMGQFKQQLKFSSSVKLEMTF